MNMRVVNNIAARNVRVERCHYVNYSHSTNRNRMNGR